MFQVEERCLGGITGLCIGKRCQMHIFSQRSGRPWVHPPVLPKTSNTTLKTHGDVTPSCIRTFSTIGAAYINHIQVKYWNEHCPWNTHHLIGVSMPIVGRTSEHVPHIFSVLYHTILNYQRDSTLGRHRRTWVSQAFMENAFCYYSLITAEKPQGDYTIKSNWN
jgi:hypothetical protein